MELALDKEIVEALKDSGIETTLKDRVLEFLKENSPPEHHAGWDVSASLSKAGIKLSVSHETLDSKGVAMFEYGLTENSVVYATLRKLEDMMTDEFPEMILEAIL